MEKEIYRALRSMQDKYAYFLMTAAGAAIAFAVTLTQGAQLSWTQAPLAVAVLSWGVSFFAGCRHLQFASTTLHANAAMVRIQAGRYPGIGSHPQKIDAASKGPSQRPKKL